MNAAICRRLLGPHKILGVSAQTVEQAVQAEKDGADYLGTGAIYPTMYAYYDILQYIFTFFFYYFKYHLKL